MADDSPEDVRSGRPANLQDLPPEVIGRSARYLDVCGGNLRQLVTIVAGRNRNHDEAMRIIKRVYLKHNGHYLVYVSQECRRSAVNILRRNHLGDMVRHWMEINDDWRNSIKPYQGVDMPGMFVDVELKAMRDRAAGSGFLGYDGTGHVRFPPEYARKHFSGDEVGSVGYAIVVGIDGRDVSGLDPHDVLSLLDEDLSTKKKIRLMCSWVANLFLNPALAIDLGLTEILRYLVEDVEIDVNSQRCRGVAFRSRMPLIAHALIHPIPSAFQYLLSTNGIDANPVILSSFQHLLPFDDIDAIPVISALSRLQRTTTLVHELHIIKDALGDSPLDASRIEALLRSDEANVDVRDGNHRTPLMCCLYSRERHTSYDRNDVVLLKVFLDAGASARNFKMPQYSSDREGHAGMMSELLQANSREERDRIIASLDRPMTRIVDGAEK